MFPIPPRTELDAVGGARSLKRTAWLGAIRRSVNAASVALKLVVGNAHRSDHASAPPHDSAEHPAHMHAGFLARGLTSLLPSEAS